MKKLRYLLISILVILITAFTGCSETGVTENTTISTSSQTTTDETTVETTTEKTTTEETTTEETIPEKTAEDNESVKSFSLDDIPTYSGEPYVVVNDNMPFFTKSEIVTDAFEKYSELDSLGRCSTAYANVCQEIMPTDKRGKIGMIKPSGWHTVKYDCVDGKYLYNRCHLIGFQLSGENANEKNLITGTRYMNVEGMLPFENMTADYVKETDNHVLYRVTPLFDGDNLVASGVLMEARSVEDEDDGIMFCVFVYNVQPGVKINYSDGGSSLVEPKKQPETATTATTQKQSITTTTQEQNISQYIININTGKFHHPDCSSVARMNQDNKKYFEGDRNTLINQGYSPCKNCNP